MKNSLIFLSALMCAGCQSAPPTAASPVPAAQPAANIPADLELKLARQARLVAALVEQNAMLSEKLAAPETPVPAIPAAVVAAPTPPPLSPPVEAGPELPLHVPNADGVIDLSIAPGTPGAPVNPFSLRAAGTEARREISLLVQGIVAGPHACALINDRMSAVGDPVESLRVERIEPDAVILAGEGFRLKIPPTEKPVRVRLPL